MYFEYLWIVLLLLLLFQARCIYMSLKYDLPVYGRAVHWCTLAAAILYLLSLGVREANAMELWELSVRDQRSTQVIVLYGPFISYQYCDNTLRHELWYMDKLNIDRDYSLSCNPLGRNL